MSVNWYDTVAEAGKKCLAAGMDACISKPVRLCDLETALAFREQEEVACTPERGRM